MPDRLDSMPATRRNWPLIGLTILVFVLASESRGLLRRIPGYSGALAALPDAARWLVQTGIEAAIVLLGLWLVSRVPPRRTAAELGLSQPFLPAAAFSFLACLPMLVIGPIAGKLTTHETALGLLFGAGIWPFAEELLYRGYALGQLIRRGGLGFWTAAIVFGLAFGAAHLGNASVQAMDLADAAATVALISIGGIFFGWLYVRWNYNLWVPFGVHAFMNLWWAVFDMAENPLGGTLSNSARLLTLLLAVALTLYRDRIPLLRRVPAAQ